MRTRSWWESGCCNPVKTRSWDGEFALPSPHERDLTLDARHRVDECFYRDLSTVAVRELQTVSKRVCLAASNAATTWDYVVWHSRRPSCWIWLEGRIG